ncbi:MAG: MFS transporter [Oscillospiraceae bacterium]|nr:MFS transporter [Oscillospiraceae bacterium]
MEKKNNRRIILIVVILGVLGQIAWGLENSWFNTYTYDVITTETWPIALMNGASALVATLTTFMVGIFSDREGKRKPFIRYGYVIWGFFTAAIILAEVMPNKLAAALTVVIIDCVMTFFGSTAYDACYNAWTTDISDESNRGKITAIVQIAPLVSGVILVGAGAIIDSFGYHTFFIGVGALVSVVGLIVGGWITEGDDLKPDESRNKNIIKDILSAFGKQSRTDNRELFLILSAFCILAIGFQVSYAYEMIYANNYLEVPKTYATLLTAGALPFIVAASFIGGKLVDSDNGAKGLAISPILFFVGAAMHGMSKNIVVIIIARIFLYVGYFLMTVTATAMFKNLTPEDSRGRFEGVRMVFVVLLPMIIGPQIGSFLINHFGLNPILYFVTGVVGLFAYIPLISGKYIRK